MLFRDPLSAFARALVLAGGFSLLILLFVDIAGSVDNPSRSLVTFVIAPFIITLGVILFLVAMWVQVRAARRRGKRSDLDCQLTQPTQPICATCGCSWLLPLCLFSLWCTVAPVLRRRPTQLLSVVKPVTSLGNHRMSPVTTLLTLMSPVSSVRSGQGLRFG